MRRHVGRGSQAQSLVEFVLILPIFLLLVFGIVDMGRFVYMNSTLSQAAREGARLAAVEAYWVGRDGTPEGLACGNPGGPVCPADLAALRSNVLGAANRMMIPFGSISDANLHLSCDATAAPATAWTSPPRSCSARSTGDLASVRVVMVFQPITPIIGQLFSSIQSAASATMAIN
jgi:TadE-like protein